MKTLHQLSDPDYYLDKEKQEKFDAVNQEMQKQLKPRLQQMFNIKLGQINEELEEQEALEKGKNK